MEKQDEKAVVLYSGPADRHAVLARYGSAKLVRVMAERIQLTEKGKHGLEWHEALLVGQASLATGLSPFEPQPELWHWIQIKNGERKLTIMRGRDGTIRLSEEAARRDGTYLLPPKFTLIDEARARTELGFNEDDLVVMCQVFDHRASDEYYNRRRELRAEGMESEVIDARLGGEPPSDVGYASMSLKEKSEINRKSYGTVKFPHINRVQKRAYVEALKKRWAAHINMHALGDLAPMDDDAYSIEGEWQEIDVQDLKDVTPAGDPAARDLHYQDQADLDAARAAAPLPGDPARVDPAAGERPYPPARVVEGVQIRIEKHKGARRTEKWPGQAHMNLGSMLGWMLQACFDGPDDKVSTADQADAVCQYLFAGDGVEKVTGAECRAALEWLAPFENGQGDLVPNALAAQEARLIWKEWNDGEEEKA